jgi:hypothetical protein
MTRAERDKKRYAEIKADPVRYAALLDRKNRELKKRQEERGYETARKREWRKRNPEATDRIRRAGHAVEAALLKGTLVRPKSCSGCGKNAKVEGHHHKGYAPEHWLDVRWFCTPCHRTADQIQRLPYWMRVRLARVVKSLEISC